MLMVKQRFKNSFAENIFKQKYSQGPDDTWDQLADRVVEDVCGSQWGKLQPLMSKDDRDALAEAIKLQQFIPGGRYLYYAGRPNHYFNNCFLLRAEHDTREEWAEIAKRSTSCLMTGGGIGVDYSVLRGKGKTISRTGGVSSGPLSLMNMVNEIGRNVMQGGSRRSAIYASLNWQHDDIEEFLKVKNWSEDIRNMKSKDFNFPAPLDQHLYKLRRLLGIRR
jgi:ribonucleoside-diphosphate reductase alpha chain